MSKTLRALFLTSVSVIILYTNSPQAAASLVGNRSLVVLESAAIDAEEFLLLATLEKITNEEDLDYDYYKVTAVLTYRARPANVFKAVIAMWTTDGKRVELLAYEPCDQAPGTTAFTIDKHGTSVDFSSDSPGKWSVETPEYEKDGWVCHAVDWEMVFEISYCWEHLEVTSLWKVPENTEAEAEVQTFLGTAIGNCWAKTTQFVIRPTKPIRFPILEVEKRASQ